MDYIYNHQITKFIGDNRKELVWKKNSNLDSNKENDLSADILALLEVIATDTKTDAISVENSIVASVRFFNMSLYRKAIFVGINQNEEAGSWQRDVRLSHALNLPASFHMYSAW